jgi:hypothetical protein
VVYEFALSVHFHGLEGKICMLSNTGFGLGADRKQQRGSGPGLVLCADPARPAAGAM